MHGIFSEYYFDLVVAMILFGLLGVMIVVDEYHVAIGVLVVAIMIVFMMVSGIIVKYYFGYHVTFGLLVSSISFIMMLDDIMFWNMMMEMMLPRGS